MLVDNVCAVAAAGRAHALERRAPPPGDGAWAHAEVVAAYLDALERLYDASTSYATTAHVDALWTELVERAAAAAAAAAAHGGGGGGGGGEALRAAVSFFRAGVGRNAFLERPVLATLLRRIPALPAAAITRDVYALAWAMFTQVRVYVCVWGCGKGGG